MINFRKPAVLIVMLGLLLGSAALFYFQRQEMPAWKWNVESHRLPAGQLEFGSAAVDGKIYLIGGMDNEARPIDRIDRFDPENGILQTLANLPFALHHPAVAALGETIYIAGGFSFAPGDDKRQLEEEVRAFAFNARTGILREVASLPEPKSAFELVAHNGFLYAIGGQDGNFRSMNTVERYDPERNMWEPVAPLVFPGNHLTAFSDGSRIFALGGRVYQNTPHEIVVRNYDAIQIYDPETNQWRLSPIKMPRGKSGHAGVMISNRFIIVYGGEEYATAVGETHIFDTATNSWQNGPTLNIPRHGLGDGIFFNGKVYAIAGSPRYGLGATDTVETLTVDIAALELLFRR